MPSFDLENLLQRPLIQSIGCQTIESLGGEGYYTALENGLSCFFNSGRICFKDRTSHVYFGVGVLVTGYWLLVARYLFIVALS